ncbi:MAG: PAS domain-containing protein [Bryobacteraceae bacterium]
MNPKNRETTPSSDDLGARVRRQQEILRFAEIALGEHDMQALMNAAVECVKELLGVEMCKATEFVSGENAMHVRASTGWKPGIGNAPSDGFAEFVFRSTGSVVVEDFRSGSPVTWPPILRDHGATSGIGVAISGAGRPFGALTAHSTASRHYDDDEVRSFETIANLLAAAVQRLRDELSRARLAAIVEATPDFVAIADLDQGSQYVNTAGLRMVGRSPDEAARVRVGGSIAPRLRSKILDEAIPAAIRDGVWQGESALLGPDGREIPVSQVILSHKSDDGKVKYLSTIARDISELKAAEEMLRHSETILAAAQSVARIGSWDEDVRTHRLSWSAETHRIFGIPRGTEVNQGLFYSRVHPEDQRTVRQAVAQAMSTRKPYSIEHRIVMPDGSVRYVQERAEVFYDDAGQPVRMVGTVQDITDRRRLEEQLRQSQKMEAIGRLAGGVSHDFNNLLTVIGGYARALHEDLAGNSTAREHLEEILKAADRAAALTRQLLTLSRREITQTEVFNLNELLSPLNRMLGRLIGEDIDLEMTLDPRLGSIRADPGQIEQVILNLVVNARGAMPNGGRLLIETANLDLDASQVTTLGLEPSSAGPWIRLSVSDNGCGMDPQTLALIFEPFFTTKPAGKGTGLGLSTVYGIVRQSGGVISVYSEPSVGSTFLIYMPRVAAARRETAPLAPQQQQGSETILLVEDEPALRKLVRQMLTRLGYTVIEADCGAAALRVAADHDGSIDLLLTDVVMPGMNGRELATRLTDEHTGIRVLFMSGYTDDAIVHHGVLEREVPFLQKPFTPDALANKIRALLEAN